MRKADEQGFREFAVGHAASLRRTAYLFCGDWHTAEDLMQASLLKLYRAWPRIEWRDNASGYARKVLLRTWLDEKRRPWRRAEQCDGEVPDVADPERSGERLWARDLVHAALPRVPPGQRAALVLRYFEDLPVSEVAMAMGCTEGTVKSQTARGLVALRAAVEELGRGALPAPWSCGSARPRRARTARGSAPRSSGAEPVRRADDSHVEFAAVTDPGSGW